MDAFEKGLMRLNRWALIALLAAMAVIIFANVVLRYSTSQSIEWAEEVARYLMVWLTFLGAGPVLRYGGHIAVDNLQDSLPRGAAVALRWLIARCCSASSVSWSGTACCMSNARSSR